MFKIANLSTLFREYLALLSVKDIPFSDVIFSAKKDGTGPKISDSEPEMEIPTKLMNKLQMLYNSSQLNALTTCLRPNPIALIQVVLERGKKTR